MPNWKNFADEMTELLKIDSVFSNEGYCADTLLRCVAK